jgi:hypothetical protein
MSSASGLLLDIKNNFNSFKTFRFKKTISFLCFSVTFINLFLFYAVDQNTLTPTLL